MRTLPALLLLAAALFASDLAGEYFTKGNGFYEKGDFDSALVCYEKIISMGIYDPRVYYNMGNAFFRKKALGPAILNYEKALKLDPSDKDAAANLRFVYANAPDKIVETRTSIFFRVAAFLHGFFPLQTEAWILLVLINAACALFIISRFAHPRFRGRALTASVILASMLLLISLSFFQKIKGEKGLPAAVVLSPKIDVRNEPEGAQVLFSVHEGARFSLVRSEGDWYLGSLANGLSGWIRAADLGLIELPD